MVIGSPNGDKPFASVDQVGNRVNQRHQLGDEIRVLSIAEREGVAPVVVARRLHRLRSSHDISSHRDRLIAQITATAAVR